MQKVRAVVCSLLEWYPLQARDLPWRHTRDPYAIWVSEIMLQQTQVKTVIPYWKGWMRQLPTVADLAQVPAEQLHKLWEGLGYYTRVRNLQKAARQILSQHEGRFPRDYESVLNLPGIGRYTAGAICSIAFDQPTPILDGNVIRVLCRLYGMAENPKDKKANSQLWLWAEELVQAAGALADAESQACSRLNQSLMELGATLCTPRQPQCLICPVRPHCRAFLEQRTQELPNLEKRPPATARSFAAFIVEQEGRFLVRQRPQGVVNAHLWEFPNVELFGKTVAAQAHPLVPGAGGKTLCRIQHTITRYKITLEVYFAEPPPGFGPLLDWLVGSWVTPEDLIALPFSSAHRKVEKALVLHLKERSTAGTTPSGAGRGEDKSS